MTWEKAEEILNEGGKVKLPEWDGYWFKEDEEIKVLTSDCKILDTPYESCKVRDDWQETDGSRDFGGAIRALKAGKRVHRKGWNGKNMFLFLLPGSDGIPTKAIHDPALREVIEEEVGGDTFDAYGSIRMWTADKKILTGWLASQTDMLSEDWFVTI